MVNDVDQDEIGGCEDVVITYNVPDKVHTKER